MPRYKLVLGVVVGVICLGFTFALGGGIGFAVGRYSAPEASTTKNTTAGKGKPSAGDEGDHAALMVFVKAHAQDPADLEIVELKPRVPGKEGKYVRNFRVRCKLLAHSPDMVNGMGPGGIQAMKLTPKPVANDTGFAEYGKDGKIVRIHLDECQTFWNQ